MARALNRFRLARFGVVLESPDDQSFASTDLAVPLIDDVPLHAITSNRHPGVPVGLVAPPSRHWLGEPDRSYVGDDDHDLQFPVVLDGSCGIPECCGVMARIKISDATVTWSEISGRGRSAIPNGLTFTFERKQYEREIAHILEVVPTPWIDPT